MYGMIKFMLKVCKKMLSYVRCVSKFKGLTCASINGVLAF